ncbi:hypothetical protein [Endozoicomonas ascidiicola]|uniref:hypothetical protein n=1 Tax=Endozoicomonas ascidiicola TaxID=1698521 RepID=UPI000833B83D|nr:hypothetical protein [Endozoicomonas ascidiicola]USN27016.1 hypothetical protein [synthetic construct]
MKKSLSLLSLAAILITTNIQANVIAVVNAVSVVTGVSDMITPEQKEQAAKFIQQQLTDHWNPTAEGLTEIQEERAEAETLPEDAFFGQTKQEALDEIDLLYQQLFQNLLDEDINEYRHDLQQYDAEIQQYEADISELHAGLSFVFSEDEINAIKAKVKKKEARLFSVEQKRASMFQKIANQLALHSVYLSNEQLESALGQANSDDLIASMTVFPVMKEMVRQLAQASQSAKGNLDVAKRYYGLFSELISLQLFIYDQFEDRLTYDYIPKLQQNRFKSERLILETRQLISSADTGTKHIYEANLKAQAINLQAIDLYSKVLKKDREKFQKAKKMVLNQKMAADNTLATVSNSLAISSLIQTSTAMFDNVLALTTPEPIIFDNSALEQQFNDLTIRLNSN